MPAPSVFHFEYEFSEVDAPVAPGASVTKVTTTGKVTTVRCHGNLVSETAGQIQKMFQETPLQGQIVIDLGDVKYVDSAGLGALIRLKLSAAKVDGVSLRFVNIGPGLMTLLRISNLESWFTA